MKLIKHSEPRYYITSYDEAIQIKRELQYKGKRLEDLAKAIGINRASLYRKLSYEEQYRQHYFLEQEVNIIMEMTGLNLEIS